MTVYTGTFGTLKYPNKEGQLQAIYLMNKDNQNYIPAPKFYWKLLLNEVTKEAVAFVGLNDPHAPDLTNDELFCQQTSCSDIRGSVL